MTVNVGILSLGMAPAQCAESAATNLRPPYWPPPRDFPVVIDADGTVVSKYGDSVWYLWPWAGKPLSLNFGDGKSRKGMDPINSENADLLRQIVAWYLYGPRAVQEPATLKNRFKLLRSIFVLCSKEGILVRDLYRFPAVVDKVPPLYKGSRACEALGLLHVLHEQCDELGFTILDRAGLRRFTSLLPKHVKKQTAYIPPRIWSYQLGRLRDFLEDFHTHRKGIEDCYKFYLDAYITQASGSHSRYPYSGRRRRIDVPPFDEMAKHFRLDGLMERWLLPPNDSLRGDRMGVRLLSWYLGMVGYVGTAYLLNFSLMRIEECWSLQSGCLEVEHDDRLGDIYLLCGPTTKTVKDGDARWVSSPSSKLAVDAMECVSNLRMLAWRESSADREAKCPAAFLVLRPNEPWANNKSRAMPLVVRPTALSYRAVVKSYPNLFDLEKLRITQEDLNIARQVTPTLSSVFSVGKVWPIAWHQLRRTGAVNMQASGIVSDASLQYQLKHASRAMTLYYGRGMSRVGLNEKARNEFIQTMYEVLALEIEALRSDRFVSPHGPGRKDELLNNLISSPENKKLIAAAKAGKISYRAILLGGCMKIGPCPYGGVDNIARCAGGDGKAPCINALFDRKKVPAIRELGQIIDSRLYEAPKDSPLRDSLQAQKRSVENTLKLLTQGVEEHGAS